jgi:oxygen-independent coproporphyrinogen-3 oxidase
MDLVYGLPNQTLSSMNATLQAIGELAPDRLLCLAFLRRPDIFLHQRSLDPAAMPSLADKMAMFNAIADTLQEASYTWIGLDYFVSDSDPLSAARQNGEIRRNWIGYTSVDTEIVLGFGTGAVSELPGIAVENYSDIGQWSDALWVDRLPIRVGSRLSPSEVEQRRALSDLMCNMELKGCSSQVLDDEAGPLARLRERGFIAESGADRLAVTEQGRFALHQYWGDASPVYRWASGF